MYIRFEKKNVFFAMLQYTTLMESSKFICNEMFVSFIGVVYIHSMNLIRALNSFNN